MYKRQVLDCILVGKFADPQECAAAVGIADGISALGIDMEVAKMDIAGVVEANRGREGRAGTGDAVGVIVGDGNVLRPVKFLSLIHISM